MLLSTPLRLVADGLRQFHAPCEDDQSQFIDLAKITIIVLHGVSLVVTGCVVNDFGVSSRTHDVSV
jgi:hypothetical protein